MTCELEEYTVRFIKNGAFLDMARATVKQIEWSRVLDNVSDARVTLSTAGENCCGQSGAIDHWNTDMVISARNSTLNRDEVIWRGPCLEPEYGKGEVSVSAVDVLGWLRVRIMEQDMDFKDEDVVDIFEALATYGLTKDAANIPVYSILKYASGIKESRKVDKRSLRMVWNIVDEMLQTGLDVTTFGTAIIAGIPAFGTLDLKDSDVLGDVKIAKDGKEFANRAVANAARDITGIYPPGDPKGSNGYPLVETLVVDSQLPDKKSAESAAKARQEFSANGVRRVRASGGLVLLQSSNIDPNQLIAGQLFNFQASETCYTATETLRLGRLNVVITAGKRTATIDLQPAGSFQTDV